MMEQAVTDYVGATILALKPHFTPVTSWHDPGMPAAAIVLDGYRRQITWTPDSGWRYTRLHTGTAAQRGPAYYLDAGPVPAPQVLVDRLCRWQAGGEAWSLTQPSYPPGGVLEALRAAVPDATRLRSCPDCGRWRDVDPGEHARCETCDTDLPQRAALDEHDAVEALGDIGRTAEAVSGDLEDGINAELLAAHSTNERLRAELAEANHVLTVTGEKLAAVRGQRDRAEAERDEARAELAAYHAAAESTDLEGDVGDHLTPLADWQTENGTAPEWLVDAVIGLIAPVKAERDRLTEQVNGDRLHTVIEAALIAYWCLERGKREPDRLDLANAWSHAAVLVDALRRAGLPTGREALHDAHGVGDAVASALSRLDGAEADQ